MVRFNATVADESFRTFHPTSLLRTPWELTRRAIVVPYKERTPVLPNISFSQWKNRESLCHYYTRSKLFAHGGTQTFATCRFVGQSYSLDVISVMGCPRSYGLPLGEVANTALSLEGIRLLRTRSQTRSLRAVFL